MSDLRRPPPSRTAPTDQEMLEAKAGSLGIDYRTRNYFVLDGDTGSYLAGSADASELPREQTANLLTARNAVVQG